MRSRGGKPLLCCLYFFRKEENTINKLLFEIITSPFDLPVNPILEYLLLGIIAIIAFNIAWEASPGGVFGSSIHYAVRTVVFIIVWAITRLIIALIKWIIANTFLAIAITIGLILMVISIFFVVSLMRKRKSISNV